MILPPRLIAALLASGALAPAPAEAQQPPASAEQAPAPDPAAPASAMPDPAAAAGPTDPHEIVVVGGRVSGELAVAQAPVKTMSEEDIAAYGVNSISDLIAAVAPETGSGRGRGGDSHPVILVNGQRISSFRELRNYPPEAIRKVEVYPEEVALRFGFPPDQRVINIVLKDHFQSRTAELDTKAPGRGGTDTVKAEASLLRLQGKHRFNLALNADHTTRLTEAQRGVIQQGMLYPGDPDPAFARTLVSRASDLGANLTWTAPLAPGPFGGTLTLNGAASHGTSAALTGLPATIDPAGFTHTAPTPLTRATRTETVQAGAAIAKPLTGWQLAATLDTGHVATVSDIAVQPTPAAARTIARATNLADSATALATLSGRPFALPAGAASLTLKTGFAWSGSLSRDTRQAGGALALHRGDASAGFNLALPIASRREGVWEALGDLTFNASGGIDRLSDFGWLTQWSAGLTWGITERLSLQTSYIVNQAAPSLAQLGAPVVITPNVLVYDLSSGHPTSGRSVLISETTGGNPLLARQTQRDLKLGLTWSLPFLRNSNLIAEYFRNGATNVSAAFPALSPAVEAAFPGRISRDAAGNLVAIDARPVTLAQQREQRLRWGINLGGPLGQPPPQRGGDGLGRLMRSMGGGGPGGPPPGGAPAGGSGAGGGGGGWRGGGRGGFGGFGGGGGGQGRWNLSLYHTVQFIDRVALVPGGTPLDLLAGDALGGSGGVARQALEFEGGGFYRGLGLRLSGNWAAPTHVRGGAAPGSTDLRFGAVTRLNLRLFTDLGAQPALTRWDAGFKGLRLSFYVNNLLDSRQKVTDTTGAVPPAYQPDLLDPLGRVIGLELRKLF